MARRSLRLALRPRPHASHPHTHPAAAYEGLELRVKGNGLRYKLILRTDAGWDTVGYTAYFDTQQGEAGVGSCDAQQQGALHTATRSGGLFWDDLQAVANTGSPACLPAR